MTTSLIVPACRPKGVGRPDWLTIDTESNSMSSTASRSAWYYAGSRLALVDTLALGEGQDALDALRPWIEDPDLPLYMGPNTTSPV